MSSPVTNMLDVQRRQDFKTSTISPLHGGSNMDSDSETPSRDAPAVKREMTGREYGNKNDNSISRNHLPTQSRPSMASQGNVKSCETQEILSLLSPAAARQRRKRDNERAGLACLPAQWTKAEAVEALWDLAEYFGGDQGKATAWALLNGLASMRAGKRMSPSVTRSVGRSSILIECPNDDRFIKQSDGACRG
jgi:hypothetical protein